MARFAFAAYLSTLVITSLSLKTLGFAPNRSAISFGAVVRSNVLYSSPPEDSKDEEKWTEDEVEQVGNLIADDEWLGLGMELSEIVRVSVIEGTKKSSREFLGKDEYAVGDFSKELDSRVKDEVAKLRGKEEYELGDLSMALDKIGKDMTCELTGKDDYEFGDLSTEIDTRVKGTVAEFCGKDEYEFGDLSAEVSRRSESGIQEFIGKEDYEFGDISREIENRRRSWMKDVIGDEAAANYEFGDLTKKALTNFTGKDDYEFGDVSKKLLGNIFGKRKRGKSDN
uniref:Uncharacterized protein n=1 Tax=Eucampia antarctica TaxID=49252 RepID=A0A7S2S6J7_9STRA|mmetsp:Transcript_3733/g.3514  ORF Transcript_3733/g.3514 Transcript_3733/m.3514 type:complete len:283 (+) Transcript_3733:92-940(+)|eukprot:CAMPEP_0197837294 /NCGR_PEP_ID=MMETSP1437-20131217/31726_1 /TAXON_ID=49252 ORGANISM="Eucampia antarctica, Strain CCMP1452" /NCGR_SAMPLE_ID=MMETSP1437 /ASSEMBLY_ACC=CAM_ASM_001096 /LENGTH=282 /DNA_ID=CAMNT_0043444229 /DNA_START=91 /DNA_END=939 /DNA_ORIENTATION=+